MPISQRVAGHRPALALEDLCNSYESHKIAIAVVGGLHAMCHRHSPVPLSNNGYDTQANVAQRHAGYR